MSEQLPGQMPLFHGTVGPQDVHSALVAEAERAIELRKIVALLLGMFDSPDEQGIRHAYAFSATLEHYAKQAGLRP